MKKLIYLLLAISMVVTIGSCRKKVENSLRVEANDLFLKSRELTSSYIDSIRSSKDSTTLLSLYQNFENEITRLNYNYAAGVDYEMTEGENDTLVMLNKRMVYLRDSLLFSYAHPYLPADSMKTDTIP